MNVLLVTHLFPSPVEPTAGIFIQEQLRFLKERCAIRAVVPVPWFPPFRGFRRWTRFAEIPRREKWEDLEIRHPRYVTFPRRILFSAVGFLYLSALLRAAGRCSFDVVHAHWAYPDGFAAVAFAKLCRRPVVLTVHGSDINVFTERRLWRAEILWALRRADRVIAVSRGLREKMIALGVRSDRISVVNNGVDMRAFHPAAKPGRSTAVRRILYVGRFIREKGLEVLLRAAALLTTSREDLEFVLVGGNRERRDSQPFETLAADLGIAGSVRFVDAVPISEVPTWLRGADVFVLPSFSEGFPLSLIEAMACGVPVVSTTCGGPQEIVSEETGLLVRPGDPEALADAIRYVLDHPEAYSSSVISAHARSRYDYRRVSKRIVAEYDRAIRSSPYRP